MKESAVATKKTSKNPSPEQIRQKILDATLLLIEKQGLGDFSMITVAKNAGIGRATLYRYYTNLDGIVDDLAVEWTLTLSRQLLVKPKAGITAGECLEGLAKSILVESRKHPQLSQAVLRSLIANKTNAQIIREETQSILPDLFIPLLNALGTKDLGTMMAATHRLMLGSLMMLDDNDEHFEETLNILIFSLQKILGNKTWNKKL